MSSMILHLFTGKISAGTVITTGALIQGANEIGEAMNRGKIGTEAATKVAKAVGVYKEDTPMAPKPKLTQTPPKPPPPYFRVEECQHKR